MPLTHEHQISLLKDILSNQQTDCCGSVAEYEQVERLIQSLLVNSDMSDHVKQVLTDIHNYTQTALQASDVVAHITSNHENLSQWVGEMNAYS